MRRGKRDKVNETKLGRKRERDEKPENTTPKGALLLSAVAALRCAGGGGVGVVARVGGFCGCSGGRGSCCWSGGGGMAGP